MGWLYYGYKFDYGGNGNKWNGNKKGGGSREKVTCKGCGGWVFADPRLIVASDGGDPGTDVSAGGIQKVLEAFSAENPDCTAVCHFPCLPQMLLERADQQQKEAAKQARLPEHGEAWHRASQLPQGRLLEGLPLVWGRRGDAH